ncbi:hypothetical protein EB796_014643 [Bugula neritina]|uniref:Uncharacterized protein n=1 Tax=Bugula neritina TaxID=10212 RepID=A0A7J7JLU4_BUGNE|nr:hypothetical protein EB796_014643 [Bugula neritina]
MIMLNDLEPQHFRFQVTEKLQEIESMKAQDSLNLTKCKDTQEVFNTFTSPLQDGSRLLDVHMFMWDTLTF